MISGEWTAGVKAAAMTVDGVATEDAISAIVYTDDLNGDSEYVKIGSTSAAHIQVTVKQPSMTYADKQIAVSIGGVPLGVFTVVSVESGDGQCVLEGYDAMGTAMETAYYPSSGTMTALAVLREICDKSGVELGDVSGITDVTVSSLGIGMTCREMAGYMAALLGRNAHIDRNGALALRWYEDTGYAVTADDYYAGGLTKNDGDFTIGKIECSVTTVVSETDESGSVTTETNSTETLTAGSGDTGISIECDLMTQDILDGIYERIGSFTFRPMVIRFFGDVRVETGDLITVTDLSGSSYTVPVMQVEHSWDGGVTTTVTAVGTTASAGSYTGGALSQAVSRLTAELGIYVNLEAQHINAVNAKITTLTAEVAEVEELVAEKASIEELDAVKATIDDLDVSALTARVADIESAYITTADVETLLVEKAYITTADVETLLVEKAYITSADVDTLLATKAYITTADVETLLAEKAYITTADVDTLLATKAYITTGDVETLLAEKAYITSAEVTTLLANYASVDDLTAAVARIGTIEADYITTGTLETEILNLTTLLADYALVDDLDAVNAVIENLDAKYATIDLLNVTEQAYIEDLLVRGGILTTDLTGVTISATKYLTGVTIVGDVIQAGTLTADKLVLTGADGLIYEINATSGGLTVSELEDEVYQSYIDGSVLVAESVTADQIAAGTITGDKIAANTITADNILAATITSLEIAAGAIETENLATASVTAEKIYVTDLYALGATIGGWTIGTSAIYNGTDAMDSTVAGTYIGLDGIRQYASSGKYVNITGGVLTAYGATISGSITATSGTIGGWTITSSRILSGSSNYLGKAEAGLFLINEPSASKPWLAVQDSNGYTVFQISYAGDITLSGKMTVMNSGSAGGYLGYISGATSSGTTSGIGIQSTDTGNYVIATTAGVRMQAGSSELFITENSMIEAYGTGFLIGSYLHVSGGYLKVSAGQIYVGNGYGVYGLPSSGGSTYYRLVQMGTDNYTYIGNVTYTTVVYGNPLYLNSISYATYIRGSTIYFSGTIGSTLYMTSGIQCYDSANSTQRYVFGYGASGEFCLGPISGLTAIRGTSVRLYYDMYMSNAKYIYWYNTSGTACTMMVFGSGNALYVGNGGYVTYLHGSSIYTNVATSVSSDERLKQDWTSLDKYEGFFDGLRPMAYRLTDDPLQYHMGMSAQAVEQALTDCGLEPDDFAGLSKHTVDPDNDVWHGYEEEYALAYSEFVPLLIDQVQKLKSRVAALENN
ncbi:MAG: tail fiber domain-containing protein [Oscillospiraceae bacterium]|nr:tail fiber domain-containing protein [Oscillospiraceae bacterium]